jgi:glycerophosphoryl diester phosphodiesterase
MFPPRPRPWVIAHRGASGERPEHTRAAYELAIDQGADFIEPDLVMTRDGQMVVRHENEIGGTTNVADDPAFAERRTTRTIDGLPVAGWFTEDFTLAELQTLRARERLPELRPGNTVWTDEPILTFPQVLDIARDAGIRTGRTIGVAPELKHPSHFAALGLPMEGVFVATLKANGLTGPDAPVLVQCFEVATLRALRQLIDTPLLQLLAAFGGPADLPDLTYAEMARPDGLARIALYADAIGVETGLLIPLAPDGRTAAPTTLIEDAHDAGLKVVAWTFRAEDAFLPAGHHGDLPGWLRRFYDLGVDAVFSDFPGVAVQARRPA